ncbi:MAG: molecular chaperone HtpG [Ruminococcaceae bacterium]|nr:molecular chaperone HtpG [Oscillospiraceae bacterium]
MANKGALSVDTEHLFPIIKKWLYSEKDIFIREVASNACDAITKHKRLISLGEAEDDGLNYRITFKIDKDERTITVSDNGIGMNLEEVEKYINNIALSGAVDFISKYESDNSSGIIGHFGLGFYSMFIVAEKVEMYTRSFKGGDGVHWICDSDGSFESEPCTRDSHGTEIIMHVSDDELAYLDNEKLKSILERYCSFMPYDIVLVDGENETVINDTNPLWQRNPQDVSDEDYNEFYKKVFNDINDPLFKVHIVADYPLNFKAVLFIPARKNAYDSTESEFKLFYNSVFVADNIKEACPDHLVNFKGVLDCPELPLNVSRSYLQNDAYVRKIASHISKKVADKLNGMFTTERDLLEKNWRDMKPYFEFACMRDEKFGDRVRDNILFEKADGGFITVKEYLGDKEEGDIYYTTDKNGQSYYLQLFKDKGVEVLVFDSVVENNFAQYLESKNDKIKFKRIDSGFDSVETDSSEKLVSLFKEVCGKEDMEIKFTSLGEDGAAALISLPEDGRRFADMMRMYNLANGNESFPMPNGENLTINTDNPIIKKLESDSIENASDVAKHIYLSAVLLSRTLTSEEAKEFIKLNNKLI